MDPKPEKRRVETREMLNRLNEVELKLNQEKDPQNKRALLDEVNQRKEDLRYRKKEILFDKSTSLRLSQDKLFQINEKVEKSPSVVSEKECREKQACKIESFSFSEKLSFLEKEIDLDGNDIQDFFSCNLVTYDIFQKICSRLRLIKEDVIETLKVSSDKKGEINKGLNAYHLIMEEQFARDSRANEIEKFKVEEKIIFFCKSISLNLEGVKDFFRGDTITSEKAFVEICENLGLQPEYLVKAHIRPDEFSSYRVRLKEHPAIVAESRRRDRKAQEIRKISIPDRIKLLAKELRIDVSIVKDFFDGKVVAYKCFNEIKSKLFDDRSFFDRVDTSTKMRASAYEIAEAKKSLENFDFSDEQQRHNRMAHEVETLKFQDQVEILAQEIGLESDNLVVDFFDGKPIPYNIFVQICKQLNTLAFKVAEEHIQTAEQSLENFPSIITEQSRRKVEAQQLRNLSLSEKVQILIDDVQLENVTAAEGFFLGNPVPKKEFVELCRVLKLNWEDLAGFISVSEKQLHEVNRALENLPSIITEQSKRKVEAQQVRNLSLSEKVKLLSNDIQVKNIKVTEDFLLGRVITREDFVKVCAELNLDPIEVLDEEFLLVTSHLVPKTRSNLREKIENNYGSIRILTVPTPIALDELFVDINILNEPPSYQSLEFSDLQKSAVLPEESFNRFLLGRIRQERVPGLEVITSHPKLMILGKPGAGKSTFLQHIAIQCNRGIILSDKVPIFIRLKDLGEDLKNKKYPNLLHYIREELDLPQSSVEKLLRYGKVLFLLDGLDEVTGEISDSLVNTIGRFCEKFHNNQFILTCRVAAKEYRFSGFTDVEVADFNDVQVESFTKKWFVKVAKNTSKVGEEIANNFIRKLGKPENLQIRELAVTPILLALSCLVFQDKSEFPPNRASLYEEGIEILLIKWDNFRQINRDRNLKTLTIKETRNLLSYIASITFERNDYFFKKEDLLLCIRRYFEETSNISIMPIPIVPEELLNSIVAQNGLLIERARGIYSFSHLTFQEYFTARKILISSNLTDWESLVNHIHEKRWREVFLMVADLFQTSPLDAESRLRLIKEKSDDILASNKGCQEFLSWINDLSRSTPINIKPEFAIRAFYFDMALSLDSSYGILEKDRYIPYASNDGFKSFFENNKVELAKEVQDVYYQRLSFQDAKHFINILPIVVYHAYQQQNLLPLQKHLDPARWWAANGKDWIETLGLATVGYVDHRDRSGYTWNFSIEEKDSLKRYYNANNLLVSCLNNAPHGINSVVRREFEEALFLPADKIDTSAGNITKTSNSETRSYPAQSTQPSTSKRTILILAASPNDKGRLNLGGEVRNIDEGLRLSPQRDQFELKQSWAVRIDDLRRALLDFKPEVVHFCGHGLGLGGLAFENSAGPTQLVSTKSLAGLFGLFSDHVRCVVLNACFSEVQAKAIVEHIDFVVGMRDAIGQEASTRFSVGFYDGLVGGRTVEDAFKFGRNAIAEYNIPEEDIPVLLKKPG